MSDKNNFSDSDGSSKGPSDGARVSGLQQISSADRPYIKHWLSTGLEGYFLEGKGRWAFRPVELWIGRDYSLPADLYNLYSELPALQRTHMRVAVSEILAEMDAEPARVPILDCLLSLTRLVPIYEVLKVLPTAIGETQFGGLANKEGEDLFEKTLLTAAALAVQESDARDCLLQLTATRQFGRKSGHAPIAFLSLCRTDPDNWVQYLWRLRPLLSASLGHKGVREKRGQLLAKQFITAVGADRFLKGLGDLRLDPMLREDYDQWLWSALFEGPDAPFVLPAQLPAGQRSETLELALRDRPNIVLTLDDRRQNASIGVRSRVPWLRGRSSRRDSGGRSTTAHGQLERDKLTVRDALRERFGVVKESAD